MADILSGLVGSGPAFIFAWVFPSGVATALFVITVLRPLGLDGRLGIASLDPAGQALALGLAATAIGLVMNALSAPLYRLLEGYLWWPASLRRWGTNRARRRRAELDRRAQEGSGIERNLAQERLQRYPLSDEQIAPTRLGNAIRAFETYGKQRYRLDSQILWIDLIAVAPESLRKELETARSSVDFFVASCYLSLLFAVGSVVSLVFAPSGPKPEVAIAGVVGVLLVPIAYRSAVASCSYWDACVRALVDTGRQPLASALSLDLPHTIARERAMWDLVVAFSYYGFEERWAHRLDEFRVGAGQATAAGSTSDAAAAGADGVPMDSPGTGASPSGATTEEVVSGAGPSRV